MAMRGAFSVLVALALAGCSEYEFGGSNLVDAPRDSTAGTADGGNGGHNPGDDDGRPDGWSGGADGDGDGIPDGWDDDDDGDGIPDPIDDDDDGDGIPDDDDPDDDNDGVPDREDDDDDGDGIPDDEDDDDDGDGIPDVEDPDGGGGGTDQPGVIPEDFDNCHDGYYADYFNIPFAHAEMESAITGVTAGDDPWAHDWWDPVYWVWRTVDENLEFGTEWWPVNTGLEGDPQYFAVYWLAYLEVDATADVWFELASDDDAWAYIDGIQVADLGGIHGLAVTDFVVPMTAGKHSLELFFAERHTSESGFWFRWVSEDVRYYACP